jgi:hypothetical protein
MGDEDRGRFRGSEVPWFLSAVFQNYGDVFGRRGARIAREECLVHLTDEQRREAGCIGGRDVTVIVKSSTKFEVTVPASP